MARRITTERRRGPGYALAWQPMAVPRLRVPARLADGSLRQAAGLVSDERSSVEYVRW